jgi:hypothetical protein
MDEGIQGPVYSPSIPPQKFAKIAPEKVVDGKMVAAATPQVMQLALVPNLSLFTWTPSLDAPKEKFLIVNLAKGTSFNPTGGGSLMAYQDDRRGWFTESVVVEMSFPGFETIDLIDDSPKTTEVSGSASVSNSLDASLFGETPTGGLGFSQGVSYSLNDFKVIRKSTRMPPRVIHEYRLGMAEGVIYESPEDLITRNPGKIILDIFNSSKPGRLRKPPDRAISDFPIISQAAFRTINSPEKANLKITIDVTMVMMEKTFLSGTAGTVHFKQDVFLDVPFGHVV